MMDVALEIAKRLRLQGKGQKRSVAVTIATVGVALAVAIMLLTLAITGGFKEQIRNVITGFDGQLIVEEVSPGGEFAEVNQPIERTSINEIVNGTLPNAEVSGLVELQAMFKTRNDFEAVVLRSYNAESDLSFLEDLIVEGSPLVADSLTFGTNEGIIVISSMTANALQLSVGDNVNTLFFTDGNIRMRNPRVAAIYDSGFASYDGSVAFASKDVSDSVLGMGADDCEKVIVSNLDFEDIGTAEMALNRSLTDSYLTGGLQRFYVAESVVSQSSNYFSWLELLDTNVVVIIALMGLIALFTLVATLFIMILERTRTIGTLKTIGASNALIRKTFIALIGRIVVRGLFWGNVIALSFIIVQGVTHAVPLDPAAYFISFVPVSISVLTVVVVDCAALLAALLAMILPSSLISRLSPATTLRFE